MSKISVKSLFGADLERIFNQYTQIDQVKYGFHSIDEIEQNSLLIIGLNPSRKENDTKKLENPYYTPPQSGNHHPFWKTIEGFSEKIGLSWTHLDLLVMRETQQHNVRDLLKDNIGVEFIGEQLCVAKKILEAATPKIIVVANTLSRLFLGKTEQKETYYMGYNFEFDDNIGTHRITNEGALKGVPVFFSSMLSGQRALDLGSKERLIWQIKRTNQILDTTKK